MTYFEVQTWLLCRRCEVQEIVVLKLRYQRIRDLGIMQVIPLRRYVFSRRYKQLEATISPSCVYKKSEYSEMNTATSKTRTQNNQKAITKLHFLRATLMSQGEREDLKATRYYNATWPVGFQEAVSNTYRMTGVTTLGDSNHLSYQRENPFQKTTSSNIKACVDFIKISVFFLAAGRDHQKLWSATGKGEWRRLIHQSR